MTAGKNDALRFLDCTLRDGGFYTNWDFPLELVDDCLSALDAAGVDYAEIGYRSLTRDRWAGAWKFTPEWLVDRIAPLARLRLAVMVDAKEFRGAPHDVHRVFGPASHSRIGLVRVAAAAADVDTARDVVAELSGLGYLTTINLMALANVPEADRRPLIERIAESAADVVYVADSYGSLHPDEVAGAVRLVRSVTNKPCGVHLHDNLQLAFANALAAYGAGATWVDASVLGMGRGPGNLRTELFLQHAQSRMRHPRLEAAPVYGLIERHFEALHGRHGWGPGPAYFLSGHLGVHPTYAQQLLATGRYGTPEVTRILERIHRAGAGTRFDAAALSHAISTRSVQTDSAAACGGAPPAPSLADEDWSTRDVLVIGRGPSASVHAEAINRWIRETSPVVLECNHVPGVAATEDHWSVFLVEANARSMAAEASALGKRPLIGLAGAGMAPAASAAFVESYRVRPGRLALDEECVLPHDVVSMFAIGQAVRRGARRIDVVGFDGYAGGSEERDRRMQSEMEEFLALLRAAYGDVELRSLTPTTFSIPTASLYGLLEERRTPAEVPTA